MKAIRPIKNIELDKLLLDDNNPRFAELYVGDGSQDDLIQYLLDNEAGSEVAKAIVKADEFYSDRPLWVLKKEDTFIVKDGNRRCAAVKALQLPGKFGLDAQKMDLKTIPAIVYENEEELDSRIFLEHANNTFRSWERIAKALEVYRLFKSGTDLKSMVELDSQPSQLIKLASFYKSAVIHGNDDLKKLLTRGRGKTGGRTIIFERLFKYSEKCGYKFKNSPSFEILVTDSVKFKSYIIALIKVLESDTNYEIKTETMDKEKESFMKRLKTFGFDYFYVPIPKDDNVPNNGGDNSTKGNPSDVNSDGNTNEKSPGGSDPIENNTPKDGNTGVVAPSDTHVDNTPSPTSPTTPITPRGSVKKKPKMKRKQLPPGLKSLVDEYFNIDGNAHPNSKVAMTRVTFECVLKYVIEHTKYNGRTYMNKVGHFNPVYNNSRFTDFTVMKNKFAELILNQGNQNMFKSFDIDKMHQIIHNYKVIALPADAISMSHNLLEIIEFLLQDEADLIKSLDINKLNK